MKYFFLATTFFLPIVASAYVNSASDLISAIYKIVTSLIPIVAALALVVFFWGLGRFVYNSKSEEAHEEGKRLMFWGIIAIFVLFCIWGIISFISSDLGLNNNSLNGGGFSFSSSFGVGAGSDGGSGSGGYRYYQPSNNPNDNSSCLGPKTPGLHWSDFLGKDNCY